MKYALRAFLHDHPDPAQALERLNDFLVQHAPAHDDRPHSMVSVAVAVLDTADGRAQFGAAGAE